MGFLIIYLTKNISLYDCDIVAARNIFLLLFVCDTPFGVVQMKNILYVCDVTCQNRHLTRHFFRKCFRDVLSRKCGSFQ